MREEAYKTRFGLFFGARAPIGYLPQVVRITISA